MGEKARASSSAELDVLRDVMEVDRTDAAAEQVRGGERRRG